MPQEPAWNDSGTDLWRKIAQNYYEYASSQGYQGAEPNGLDDIISSMRKVCEYTEYLASQT